MNLGGKGDPLEVSLTPRKPSGLNASLAMLGMAAAPRDCLGSRQRSPSYARPSLLEDGRGRDAAGYPSSRRLHGSHPVNTAETMTSPEQMISRPDRDGLRYPETTQAKMVNEWPHLPDCFQSHISGPLCPYIFLFEQGCADEPHDRIVVREGSDDLGAPLDLALRLRSDSSSGAWRDVLSGRSCWPARRLGFIHDCRQLRHVRPDLAGDGAPLYGRGLGRLLGEGSGYESGDDAAPALAGMGRHVPSEVDVMRTSV